MSKKFLVLILLLISWSQPLWSDEFPYRTASRTQSATPPPSKTAVLHHGLRNIATGWTEVPKKIDSVSRQSDLVEGLVTGTAKGFAWALARTGWGIYEVGVSLLPPSEVLNPGNILKPLSGIQPLPGIHKPTGDKDLPEIELPPMGQNVIPNRAK